MEQAFAVEQVGQRLRSQADQQFMIERIETPEHCAEAPRIGVTQGQARLQLDVHMLMLGRRQPGLHQTQIA
ncbi:hypothetical protein D3C78_1414580 [compost metagenome]